MRPLLLIVDVDPGTRRDLGAALDRRFGGDYRIEAADGPEAALGVLREVERDTVAIVIADVWLPEEGGLAFLHAAHALHPGAIRVLMFQIADMAAMGPLHSGMGLGQIDNFIMKPSWHWPEEYLYPQMQEALTAWSRLHGPRMEMIRIVGERWSARSHELRDRLSRNIVPLGFYDADSPEGAEMLAEHGLTTERLPAVIFFNGHTLVDPTNAELARAIGVQTRPRSETYDVAVIGAGPAGLAAAVYGASEGLETAVVESQALGGQAGTSSNIRNYLGFPRGVKRQRADVARSRAGAPLPGGVHLRERGDRPVARG